MIYGTRQRNDNDPFGSLFARLAQSKFRSGFSLKATDKAYVRDKGMDKIRSHACDFISKRLAPAEPVNDGKQTPMIHVRDLPRQIMDEGHAIAQMRDSEWRGSLSGHPVFIAQHATGCCCRGCLEKWHRIPKGIELSDDQQEYVVDVLMAWIERQMKADIPDTDGRNEIQI